MINRTIRHIESTLGRHSTLPVFLLRCLSRVLYGTLDLYGRFIMTPWNLRAKRKSTSRRLEVGPGPTRIPDFETVNIGWGTNVDFVADASRKLPFADDTFELVYASHVLEHVPWYRLGDALEEWVRVLAPGGTMEIWVPNGLKIAKTFIKAEEEGESEIHLDGWYRFNDDRDPCVWMNGRTFSYGDGLGTRGDPNWHLALFSPRYLQSLLESAGLESVVEMEAAEVRGNDHGWINLGLRGTKRG